MSSKHEVPSYLTQTEIGLRGIYLEYADDSVAHFEGYRVQHNTSHGPGKSGARFHRDATQHGSVTGFTVPTWSTTAVGPGRWIATSSSPPHWSNRSSRPMPTRSRRRLSWKGAEGPSTPVADDILHDKGVLIVPDVIPNAGGVTVSYFEWVQDFSCFFWTGDEINQRLTRIMRDAFAAVGQLAEENKVSLCTAAFIVACSRVLQAHEMRGLYP